MKKLAMVLLLWLCACCLIFGQVSSSRRRLFNEAVGRVGKRVPSGWIEYSGQFWKSLDIAVGTEYTALEAENGSVSTATVGCLFNDDSVRSSWLKAGYDTLIADGWKVISNEGEGNWVLGKGKRMAVGVFGADDDSKLSASVVFM